jgi:hypothetical protein
MRYVPVRSVVPGTIVLGLSVVTMNKKITMKTRYKYVQVLLLCTSSTVPAIVAASNHERDETAVQPPAKSAGEKNTEP